MYGERQPNLFAWMDLDAPEVRAAALRAHGLYRKGMVHLRISYRACPLCGRLTWRSAADPLHPQPPLPVEDAEVDERVLVERYRDHVRVEVVPPEWMEVDKDVCESCQDAYQRAPEVMQVMRNMVRMMLHERDQAAKKAAEEG